LVAGVQEYLQIGHFLLMRYRRRSWLFARVGVLIGVD
jgi:hypothetical protein